MLLSPLRGRQSDLDITERAVRQGWPLSPEKRQKIIEECARLALESGSERTRVQAMRVLVMMDSLNLKRERNDQDANRDEKRIEVDRFRALWDSLSPDLQAQIRQATLEKTSSHSPPVEEGMPPPALLGAD